MGSWVRGILPSGVSSKAARICVCGPLLLVAGCASDKQASYVNGPHQQMAAQQRKIEMEDDGMPVQPPPARAVNPAEDDPTQPWSPNYGRGVTPGAPVRATNPNLPRQVDAALPYVPIPAHYSPAAPTSTGSLTQLSEAEANAMIARAVSDHEMRRQ